MWLLALAMLAPASITIYVATDGNDGWSGTLARPNRAQTDGPVKTIQAGEDLANQGPYWTVKIEPGHFRIEQPLEFAEHTWPRIMGLMGPDGTVEPLKRGTVFIDGSRRVEHWQLDARGWWHANLPDVASGKWNFIQLWVNGERRFRPRSTGEGYAHVAGAAPPTAEAAGKGFDRFVYARGDINPAWHNLSDVEILAFHNWSMARMRIKAVDDATHTVTFTGHSPSVADWSAFPKGNPYIVENVREALGKPGEWYLDRPTGELTYVPRKGETPANTDVEAPIAPSLVNIRGAAVSFVDLYFEYTNWVTPPNGHDFPQADIDVGAAITVSGTSTSESDQHSSFSGCTIAHTGGYAIQTGLAACSVQVYGSTLDDLGGGGVMLGSTSGSDASESMGTIQSCRIVSGGRLHPAAVGVWIGDSAGNTVLSNEIRDFYYTGVSVGWTWGYGAAHSGKNLVARNEISSIGQHVLSDMGGIYTLGDQSGTKLDGNVIHDVDCFAYGGWGIYPDEGSTNELIENNIVYRCQSAGFHQHYGKNNLVRNNIFALNGDYEIMRTRAEDHLSFNFDHNIIAWAGGRPFGSNWSGTGFEMKHNLYWHYGGLVPPPAQEPGGLVADPMFYNPEQGDFRLKAASPAFGLGFHQLGVGEVEPSSTAHPHQVKSAPRAFPDPFGQPGKR